MPIKEKIREFIYENFILDEKEDLREEDSLLEKGIIDSTGVLELVAFIEKKYRIQVEDDELVPENLDSLWKITEFIHRKLKMSTEQRVPQECCSTIS